MGNRESGCSSGSIDSTDYLASSTDSTSISVYGTTPPPPPPEHLLQRPRSQSQRLKSSQKYGYFDRSSMISGSDLCSVLNHHHDSAFEPAARSCVCRRSLSTSSTGGSVCCSGVAERPRILPIVRNGRQLSNDFYWVLPQRKKHQQQQFQEQLQQRQARLSSSSSSEHSCCEPLTFHGPGCSPLELVRRVTAAVFGVTDEESYLSLSLHHWDTERAIRYLKVEQLFRSGVGDRDRCLNLLEMHNWKLESVVNQLRKHQRVCWSESN